MKKRTLPMLLLLLCNLLNAQSKSTSEQAVEGGKVLVELIKVFGGNKENDEPTGCEGRYADLCVVNARELSLTVTMTYRDSDEKRELVILHDGKECSLHLPVGVWTYDLRQTGMMTSIRKGDLLIEGCNNITMTIK